MSLHHDLQEILHRVQVNDDHTVVVDGSRHRVEPRTIWDPSTAAATQPPALCELAALIYRIVYVRPRRRWATEDDLGAIRQFQRSLSSLDLGSGTWTEGWSFERTERGLPVLCWQGAEFATSVRWSPAVAIPTVSGASCAVRVPTQQWGLYPGYLMVLGESPWPVADSLDQPMLRLYWNITASGVRTLLGRLSQGLNRCSVPFRMKVADRPSGYRRSDAAILYLPGQEWTLAMSTLTEVYDEIRTELVPQEPMMTLRLAPGLGFAHDPGDGLSYGESCCEQVAQAVRLVHQLGGADIAGVGAVVETQFRKAGIDPSRPYLNTNPDVWLERLEQVSDALTARIRIGTGDRSPRPDHAASRTELLDIAAAMGEAICGQAYWDASGTRCTWLSRTFEANPTTGRPNVTPIITTLPPRLYDGLAGVALALAELWALRPEAELRRTAIGALRAAARHLRDGWTHSPLSSGFYTGMAGVEYAARRVSWLTGADEADLPIEALLAPRPPARTDQEVTDLIDGRAGEILALLTSWPLGPESMLPHAAADMGFEFTRALDRSTLTFGLAHGASGEAAACFALYRRTGIKHFLDRGREMIAREDALEPDPALNEDDDRRRTAAWCNGTAGVAMSRMMASVCDPDGLSRHGAAARAALADTADLLDLRTASVDGLSLCHGLAGAAETLRLGAQLFDDNTLAVSATMTITACAHAGRQGPDALEANIRRDPSLMVGAAGVLHALLRAVAPEKVATVLMGPTEY